MVVKMEEFVKIPVEKGRYLIVAPTGSGKTTAILNNLKSYIQMYDRVFLTFPTKALMYEVSQKLSRLKISHLIDNSDVRIIKNISVEQWLTSKVIVSSYEKLDSMLLLYPELLSNSLVVIDEIHLATDAERALSILSILANIKKHNADCIVMSATIPEYDKLAEYLNAKIIKHNTKRIFETVYHRIPYIPRGTINYINALVQEIEKIIKQNPDRSTIIFRASRKHCDIIAKILENKGFSAKSYHAGLPKEVKNTILKEFMDGSVKIIVATHALCWGVNTPTERVIIAGSLIYMPGEVVIGLKTVDIKQMAGRAGRPGFSDKAEVHLIYCDTGQLRTFDGELMTEKELFEKAMNEEYVEKIGIKQEPETILLRYLLVQEYRGIKVSKNELLAIADDWYNMPPKQRIGEAINVLLKYNLAKISNEIMCLTKIGKITAEYYINVSTFKYVKEIILDNIDNIGNRLDILTACAKVAAKLRKATMTIPERAFENSVVLSIADVDAREVVAQFTQITGDTEPLAESMKKIAYFVARILKEEGKDNKDWIILGKTMKQIRLMIANKVDIHNIINGYVDGTIDIFFENITKK